MKIAAEKIGKKQRMIRNLELSQSVLTRGGKTKKLAAQDFRPPFKTDLQYTKWLNTVKGRRIKINNQLYSLFITTILYFN